MTKVTEEMVNAFYKAHDASLEGQPREGHQAVYDGIAAVLKVAALSASAEPGVGVPDRLEEIAKAQKAYHDQKQQEFPSLEDYLTEDGEVHLPADIGPLLSQSHYNGRYSEGDWWLSTIQKMKAEASTSPSQYVAPGWKWIAGALQERLKTLSTREIGKLTGTSAATVSRLARGAEPTIDHYFQIVRWLGMKPGSFGIEDSRIAFVRAQAEECEGADDPEERCPRHPKDCTCWQVDNDHPSRKGIPPVDQMSMALKKADEALRPLADAVYNDNGDMTVSVPLLSSEECIQGYFASKRITAALQGIPPVDQTAVCLTCEGTGKEGRHSICRDCDEASAAPEMVAVQQVECVSWEKGYEEPADPIYRIEIDGYCADFDTSTAAVNFAGAINARIRAALKSEGAK